MGRWAACDLCARHGRPSVSLPMAPTLVNAGYRVAMMDLRGHGDSDASFSRYDDVATGQDILALTHTLGSPAIIVGNSMSAGSAVWAAAEEPGQLSGLILIGPFVRNLPISRVSEIAFHRFCALGG